MLKYFACLVILTLSANPAGAWERWSAGHHSTGVYVGYWNTADADAGFGPGLKLSLGITPYLQFEFRGSYFNDLASNQGGAPADLEAFPLEAGLVFTHRRSERLEVYGGGGIGAYYLDGNIDLPEDSGLRPSINDPIGFYLTAGVEFLSGVNPARSGITELVWFGELMYRFVQADDFDAKGGPEPSLGTANLNGLGINIGLLLRY